MENSQKTPSIIAKLMGFDEIPPCCRHVSGRQRVLSDNYLHKSGSIGKRSRNDSLNKLLRSKKKANMGTDNANKYVLTRDIRQKSSCFDAMQGMKSPVGENGKSNCLTTKIVDPRPNFGNVQYASIPSFLLYSQTVFAWEVKKQLLERLKMNKGSQKHQSEFGSSIGIISKDRKYESFPKLPIFERLNFSFNSNNKTVKTTRSDEKPSSVKLVNDMSVDTKNDILVLKPETKNDELFHSDTEDKCNYSAKEECSSHLSDLSSEQDSSLISHEDGSMSSICVQINEELPDIKVEMYQGSPNSVLEPPFREDNSSSSEYCESANTELCGLWIQLQLFKSESEENDNNPEMITSSDDERSYTDQNTTSMMLFGNKESRDFSYMVDVLDESGFQDGNIEIRFERWHSSECVASPSVFESLEKKYGKQELWHKSERRLLFDRINSGMTEILRPRVDIRDCYNPLRRKMTNILRRDVIEEALLGLLLSQEKEVNDGVSEKAVGRGRWFDLVDELDSLVIEIEIFLFEVLVAELVSA